MQRETVTVEEIRYDLRSRIREYVIDVGFCFGFFLFFCWVFWMYLRSDSSLWHPAFVKLCTVFMALLPTASLVVLIVYIA